MPGKEQENQDLQNLINAVRIGQSKGAYKLEQSEVLSGNVRNVTTYIQKNQ
jgi:hypothetical protein